MNSLWPMLRRLRISTGILNPMNIPLFHCPVTDIGKMNKMWVVVNEFTFASNFSNRWVYFCLN